jgi:hypothetical protein
MGTLKPPPVRASCQDGFRKRTLRLSLGALRKSPGLWRLSVTCHQAAMGAVGNNKTRRTTMTDTKTNENAGSKAPTHIAYHVRDGKDKGYFTRIGAAWPHKDGQGFNIQLEIMPLDGRITLRLATEKKE